MKSSLRDALDIIAGEGLNVIEMNKGKHYKIKVRTPDNRVGLLVAPVSCSDHRGLLNFRSECRRLCRNV